MSLILPGSGSAYFDKYWRIIDKVTKFTDTVTGEILTATGAYDHRRQIAKTLVLPEAGPSELNFQFYSGQDPQIQTSMSFPDHTENFIGKKVPGTNSSNGGELWDLYTDFINHPEEQGLESRARKRIKRQTFQGIQNTLDRILDYFLIHTMNFLDFKK